MTGYASVGPFLATLDQPAGLVVDHRRKPLPGGTVQWPLSDSDDPDACLIGTETVVTHIHASAEPSRERAVQ